MRTKFNPFNYSSEDMDVLDERKYKCDVCWTCEWYSYNDWSCHIESVLGMQSPKISLIEKPHWWNCRFWREASKES